MTRDPVRVETDGGLLRLVLDRPDHKNSLTPESVRTLIAALERAAADDDLRAVSIESSGPDFCAGADVITANADAQTHADPQEGRGERQRPRVGSLQRRTAIQAHRLIDLMTTLQLPIVCSVRGWAAGLGCQIALAADFTVAADDATFWEPFVARGFTPDSGASWLLPRLIGIARAKALLMLGEKIDGARAAEWGMIYRSVPEPELDEVARALIARLADGPTVALGLTKKTIQAAAQSSLVESMATEAFALELSSRTGDFREGLASFRERRKPEFEGR